MTEPNQPDSPGRGAKKYVPPLSLNLTIDPASITRLLDLLRETLQAELAKAITNPQVPQAAEPASQPVEPPPPPKSTSLDLKAADKTKAADLRVALLLGKIPEDAGLLIDARTFAKLLDVSKATLYRLQAEEAIPASVQIGNLKKWRLGEILEWIEADCPPLREWGQKRKDFSKRKGK